MEAGFKALPFKTENADVDLINYISKNGFNFFIEYYKVVSNTTISSEFDRKYFTDYLRMFLFENDSIFNPDFVEDWTGQRWNSIVNMVSNEPPNTLYGIIGFLTLDEQVKFMTEFLDTTILSIDRTTVNNLFLDKNIVKLITKTDKLRDIIMFYADRKEINDILFCLMGIKSGREKVYSTLNEIFAKYIHTNAPQALAPDEFRDIVGIKSRLLGIATALIEVYNGGNTPDKISEFKLLTESSVEATPLNNMFWFIHNFLSISFHSIEKYSSLMTDFVETLEKKLEGLLAMNVRDENNWNVPVEITNIKTQVTQLKSFNNKLKELRSDNTIKLIRDFYCSDTIYWLTCQKEVARQDMTDTVINNILDFIDFLNFPFIPPDSIVSKFDFCDFVMRVINCDNKITASPNIKGTLLSIVIRDNTWTTSLGSKHEFIKEFVDVYIYINDKQEDFEYAIDLHTILKVFLADFNYCFTDYIMTYGLQDQIDKFIHTIVDNLYNTKTRTYELLRQLNSRQNGTGNYADEEPETIDFTKDSQAIGCNFMVIFSGILERLIKMIMHKRLDCIFGIATRDKFTMTILFSINEMVGEKRNELKVRDFNGFDAIKTLLTLYELFTLSYPSKDFRKSVINETRFLNFGYLRKMAYILYEKKKALLNQEYINFTNHIHELEESFKLNNELDLDEIPDEFLDPIMGTLIDDPVMLPECETIMNRDIIYRHVLAERNNPFNRKELSISDLEAFNALEEIKEKISEFNKKKSETLGKMR